MDRIKQITLMDVQKVKKIFFIENRLQYFINNRLELAKSIHPEYELQFITQIFNKKDLDFFVDSKLKPYQYQQHYKNNSLQNSPFSIYKAILEINPDIIHIFTIKSIVQIGLVLLLLKRKNIVCSITGLGYSFISNGLKAKFIRILISVFLRIFNRKHNLYFIFQNDDDFHQVQKTIKTTIKNYSIILGSGVNTELFTPKKNSSNTLNILFGGRLLKDKGIIEFVYACKLLAKKHIKANFQIAGDIDRHNPNTIDEKELKEITESNIFQYFGHQSNMEKIISNADIICLPSYREGLSKFLIESASCGKPIVTTNVPGCKEVVENNFNGFLVEPRDIVGLAEAIEILINDNPKRSEFGYKSRSLALEKFSNSTIINQIKQVYSKLI